MAKLDELRKTAKIDTPLDERVAAAFFEKEEAPGSYRMIPIDAIDPDPGNPRSRMDPDRLQELADSIQEEGVVLPLNLYELPDGRLRVGEGHRRLAAARKAGLRFVPAIVKSRQDVDKAAIRARQLVENLHRESLPVLDTARGIKRLMTEQKLSIRKVARKISMKRSAVDEYVGILRIPDELLSKPGVDRLKKKALVAISRTPRAKISAAITVALESRTPWKELTGRARRRSTGSAHRRRFPLKHRAGSIAVRLEQGDSPLTDRQIGEAYLEAGEMLLDEGRTRLDREPVRSADAEG